jgi:hypothetical protein
MCRLNVTSRSFQVKFNVWSGLNLGPLARAQIDNIKINKTCSQRIKKISKNDDADVKVSSVLLFTARHSVLQYFKKRESSRKPISEKKSRQMIFALKTKNKILL